MPVVVVHGSPGASSEQRLRERDAGARPQLPDYSFGAHAEYILGLLDKVRIRKAQLVGFSMGSGVVLSMADIAPERVAIVLLSAIGVQERELFGCQTANHVLHGAQLGHCGCCAKVRRTGFLNLFALDVEDVEYARNFYDSDQRVLRSILEQGPMLILHGNRDPLVPLPQQWNTISWSRRASSRLSASPESALIA